jgi:Phage tail lysozyme
MDYFTGPTQGWTKEQAAALVGAAVQPESSFDPKAGAGTAHQGIAQWDDPRRAAIEAHFHKPLLDMNYHEQLQAMQWELTQGGKKAVGDRLHATQHNLGRGSVIVTEDYESPGNYEVEDSARFVNSQKRLADYDLGDNVDAVMARLRTAQGTEANVQGGTGTAGGPGATTTVKGSANVNIKLDGFPAGTKTSAVNSGDLFAGLPRVEHAMPLGYGP